jgi:uncharacterized membrane protein YgcG
MPAALRIAMIRRCLAMLPAALLAGCVCKGETLTQTAYASMATYPKELTACIVARRCLPLCTAVFQIDGDIERCELIEFDQPTMPPLPTPGPMSSPADLETLRGATVQVTYVEHVACDDDGSWWDIGGWDDGSDDVSGDDGASDGGSVDDGSDDGSTDDGSDDGSDDDPGDDGGDDGGGDGGDGGGDDGGGNATGTGSSGHHAPRPIGHATAPASSARIR